MDIFEAIETRKSIRKFQAKEIPEELIRKIVYAGLRAPSGGNRQPYKFIVVTDREKIRLFDPYFHQDCVESAPAVIIACANPHDTWEKYDEEDLCYKLDTAAAIQNMLLAIHGLGLGGVWVMSCSKRDIRKLVNIPLHWEIVSIIPFGYIDENHSTKPTARKELKEIAFFNEISNPIE